MDMSNVIHAFPACSGETLKVEKTHAAFVLSGAEMSTFDRFVHEYFFNDYHKRFGEKIFRIVFEIAERTGEVLLPSLAGKLFYKLPTTRLDGFPGDYYEAKARYAIAVIICHVLMDSGAVPFRIQHKKVGDRWETLTLLDMGGDPVKDVMKGLHFTPGIASQTHCEGWKLKAMDKARLKRLSSIPFEISDVATKELIWKGYTLKEDWDKRIDKKGNRVQEDPNTKRDRYDSYADLIMDLKGKQFYLELKYSGSGRMFYLYQLEGMRPQGKLWETLMIDSAEAYYLTEEQQKALIHLIYCTAAGSRVVPDEAAELFDDQMLEDALTLDVMAAEDEESFGEMLLLKKAATALKMSMEGLPTKYMFGWDFTNSGLIMAGLSFHSEKMMSAGNIHLTQDVVDMHSEFGKAYNLDVSRKDIKKVHMPLLHGSTWKGLQEKVQEITGKPISMEEIIQKNEEAYGPCVWNLINIAQWGVDMLHNEQTRFSWTLPDGFRASHKAYFEAVELKVTSASAYEKHASGKTTHTLTVDMPFAKDRNGMPLVSTAGAPKVRGLYANITHSLDAYVLRHVADALLDQGMPFMLKHDDYMVHPSCYEIVLQKAREAFSMLYEMDLYADAIDQIARHAKAEPIVLTLEYGHAPDVTEFAEAFLMP